MVWLTYFFEIYFEVLYLVFLVRFIFLKRWSRLLNFLSATLFGLSIEYLSIFIYDSYHYSTLFLLQFGRDPNNVPLVVAFCWAMIITCSMDTTDHFGLHPISRPFLDTLLALTLDLTMDAIAIRIDGGFWDWGYGLPTYISPLTYFGVIWANYMGWFLIVLIFSSILRLERKIWRDKVNLLVIVYHLIVPFLGYIPLYLAFEGTYRFNLFLLAKGIIVVWYWLYLVLLFVFIALTFILISIFSANFRIEKTTNILPFVLFSSFHLLYLVTYFALGFFSTIPLVGIVSIIVLIIDLVIEYFIMDWQAIYTKLSFKSK